MPKGVLSHESRLRHFWERVKKDCPGGCWEWTGCRMNGRQHYGGLYLNRRKIGAHVFSFELHHRPLKPGEIVRHSCDNQACVFPGHLLAGSVDQNVADRVERNRSRNVIGEEHGNAKLTETIVRTIRASTESQRTLAKRFGVSQSLISQVRSGLVWSHIRDQR